MKRQSLIVPAQPGSSANSNCKGSNWHYDTNEAEENESAPNRQGKKRKLPSSFNEPEPAPPPVTVPIDPRLEIMFPFEPYECQSAFIRKLSTALLNKEHALLESPTGTGKTMCLLSTVLAFQLSCLQKRLPFCKAVDDKDKARRGKPSAKVDDDWLLEGFDDLMPELSKTTTTTAVGGISPDMEDGIGNTMIPPGPDDSTKANSGKVKSKLNTLPRIWYASRTHSQLKQVVGEIKKSAYYTLMKESDLDFGIRLIIMGSRDHYCVNPELADKKGRVLEGQCRKVSVNRTCLWHNGCNSSLNKSDIFLKYTMDIDELKQLGLGGIDTLRPFCPFYASREMQSSATFILLPYNYLVNPMIREQMKIDVTGDIVIIDEGHNIESTAEDETSFSFSEHDLQSVVAAIDVGDVILQVRSENPSDQPLNVDDVNTLQGDVRPVLLEMMRIMREAELKPVKLTGRLASEECCVWSLSDFRTRYLTPTGLTADNCTVWSQLLKKLQLQLEYFEFHNQDARIDTRSYLAWSWVTGSLSTYLNAFWNDLITQSISRFRVGLFVSQIQAPSRRHSVAAQGRESVAMETSRQLHFWSFAAHVGLDGITNACHSLIITSGTLKPLDALELQLGNSSSLFPHQLENKHVITPEQLCSIIIKTTINERPINLSFENLKRAGPPLVVDIGNIIIDIISASPREGHLVFFASYSQMNNFIETWSRNQVMYQLQRKINVFQEPKAADEAAMEIRRFCLVVATSAGQRLPTDFDLTGCKRLGNSYELQKGGVFFGVCRGRVSEGLSLSDSLVRTVTIIGVPYPSLADVRLSTKRSIMDACPYRGKSQVINGSQWYMKQAYQAVNQAIGRVIRHKDDYGAIILLDARYADAVSHLSGWVKENLVFKETNNKPRCVTWQEGRRYLESFFKPRTHSNVLTSVEEDKTMAPVAPMARKKRLLVRNNSMNDEQPAPKAPAARQRAPPKGTPTLSQLFASRLAKARNEKQTVKPTSQEPFVSIGGGENKNSSQTDNRFKLGIRTAQKSALSSLIEDCPNDSLDEID